MFREWRPGISLSEVISQSSQRQHVRWRHRKLMSNRLLSEDNIISWWLEPLLEDEVSTHRYFRTQAMPCSCQT